MEPNNQERIEQSTLDLIKNEIENFRLGKNQNSPIVESSSCSCAGNILAKKLVKILEDEEAQNAVVVRTEGFLCLKFKALARDKNYRQETGKTLEDFLEESALNSGTPIYSGFIFEGGYFRLNPTLRRFFSDCGPQIQHLELNVRTLDVADSREIFLQWTPNLKSLILNPETWCSKMDDQSFGNQPPVALLLPKLRKITLPKTGTIDSGLSSPNKLIEEILTSAPNLTSVEDPYVAHFMQIRSVGKLPLLKKSLTFCFPYKTVDIEYNLKQFVATSPKLTSLTLQVAQHYDVGTDGRTFSVLFDLLALGRNTLEKVTGFEILGQKYNPPLGARLFPFPNLTELCVSTEDAAWAVPPSSTILPPDYYFSKMVPNLKTLVLEATREETYPFTSRANAHAALQKLRIVISAPHLKIPNMYGWVDNLGGHYPNVTHFDIFIRHNAEENIPEILRLIPWYFKQLEQLVLRFWMDKASDDDEPKSEWNLDAVLTGFSKDVCSKLQKQEEINPHNQKKEILNQIRTSPSIMDLEKLTKLTFEVQFRGNVQPLWSHVTQLYAFQPMEKRQGLIVAIKQSKLFSSDTRPEMNWD